jgi:hypothetical protein
MTGFPIETISIEGVEKTKKNSRIKSIVDAVTDKNLYGVSFFYEGFLYWIISLVVQYYAFYSSNFPLLIVYVILHTVLIPISGLFAKNFRKEFHPMNRWLSIILFYTSLLSLGFAFRGAFEATSTGLLQLSLVVSVSEIALIASVVAIIVISQRNSIRRNVGLNDSLFDTQKKKWEKELKGFPSLDHILEGFDTGHYIGQLFIAGYFNLAVLWSCNVIEEITDAITDSIISVDPDRKKLFRRDNDDRPVRYPLQLKRLDFIYEDKTLSLEKLWHNIRNDIAHRNYIPTFIETNETIKILITFLDEMPSIIKNQI